MVYQINLLFRVGTAQLDKAQSKVDRLRRSSSGFAGGAGLGANSFLNNLFGADSTRSVRRFSSNFLGNILTPQGTLRNISNLGGAISGVSSSLMKLGGTAGLVAGVIAKSVAGMGKSYVLLRGIHIAGYGLPLMFANKFMNSEFMGKAASNLMQLNISKKLVGETQAMRYWNTATQLAGQFGFERTQMSSLMSGLQGQKVKGTILTEDKLRMLAEATGKLAQVGAIDFSKASSNVLQIVGALSSGAIPKRQDLRELFHGTPIVQSVANKMMQENGYRGDMYTFAANNFLEIMDKFSRLVETNPLMKARGEVALAKENFGMSIATTLSPYWGDISEAVKILLGDLSTKIKEWASQISPKIFTENVEKIVTDLADLGDALVKLAPSVTKVLDFAAQLANIIGKIGGGIWTVASDNINAFSRAFLPKYAYDLKGNSMVQNPWRSLPATSSEANQIYARQESMLKTAIASRPADILNAANQLVLQRHAEELNVQPFAYRGAQNYVPSTRQNVLAKHSSEVQQYVKKYISLPAQKRESAVTLTSSQGNLFKPYVYTYGIDQNKFANLASPISPYIDAPTVNTNSQKDFGNNGSAEKSDLADLSRGSKALIINFNKEIVKIDVDVKDAQTTQEVWDRIKPQVQQTMVEGLQIALANATGTI